MCCTLFTLHGSIVQSWKSQKGCADQRRNPPWTWRRPLNCVWSKSQLVWGWGRLFAKSTPLRPRLTQFWYFIWVTFWWRTELVWNVNKPDIFPIYKPSNILARQIFQCPYWLETHHNDLIPQVFVWSIWRGPSIEIPHDRFCDNVKFISPRREVSI